VTNTGSVFGKEVVQLYVSDKESTVFRPVRELKGFEKVALKPGETRTVTFTLGKRAFAYWNVQISDWHVETGAFDIQICASSRDVLLSREVQVESTVQLPVTYTLDTLFMDLAKDPKAMAIIKPMLDAQQPDFGCETESDAAREAITPEMAMAMMQNSPLRSSISFGGGAGVREQLLAMLAQLNAK
jgi:beta-glucosidase